MTKHKQLNNDFFGQLHFPLCEFSSMMDIEIDNNIRMQLNYLLYNEIKYELIRSFQNN